jgi:hypothetical protein
VHCGQIALVKANYLLAISCVAGALSLSALSQTVSEDTAAYYADSEQLKSNIIDPILSSHQVVSADGSAFDAQASCNSENEYLRVYATPQGSGNLNVTVIHDHNLDGVFSPAQTISDVAGICHNGYATDCNGDFSHCDFFEWAVDSAFNISGTPSSMEQGRGVEGCYCINNSCGAGLYFVNQERIDDDIGTGISLAFQKTNPSFGITNVVSNNGITRFYGHDPDSCDVTETSQQVYYNHPSSIPSAAFEASATSTLFANLSSAQSAGNTTTTQACFEEHGADILQPSSNDILEITRLNGVLSVNPCGVNCLLITIGYAESFSNNGSCTQYNHKVEFDVKRPLDIASITLIDVAHDDDALIQYTKGGMTNNVWVTNLWDTSDPPSRCERRGHDYSLVNQNITGLFSDVVKFEMDLWGIAGGGRGKLYVKIRIMLNPTCETTPTVNNTCGALPSDCYVNGEVIDGVTTVANTVGTGLVPLPSSRTFISGACTDTLSRPYWRIDRTYQCPELTSPYDFSAGLDRAVTINNSISTTGYQDKRMISGVTEFSDESLSLPALPDVGPCQMSCKTREMVDELGIATMGLSAGSRPNDTRYQYSYKSCQDNICPLEGGESLETPCACLDRFSEAASAIQAFRLAGKDFICTTAGTLP